MYSRAAKQLDKFSQRVGEKVFNNQKTQLSDEFKDIEAEIEMRRAGVERLHATSIPFHSALTKLKPSPDPEANSKDKVLPTEALGLVMISYGEQCAQSGVSSSGYAEALGMFGRARCKLAVAQEDFGARIGETYIAGMEHALETVKDYSNHRKKLDSRRLALDAAITKQNSSKKESRVLEAEVETAQARFEETEEDVHVRMLAVQEGEAQQFAELTDLLEAELEYFQKCQEILNDLRGDWPSAGSSSTPGRPRAKSNASGRSTPIAKTRPRGASRASQLAQQSDDESGGRPRSHSNASTGSAKGKRSMLPSFGSFGKKSAGRTFKKDKYGSLEGQQSFTNGSDEDDERPPSPTSTFAASGRSRSQNSLAMLNASRSPLGQNERPPIRRTHTTPHANARLVKALYDFPGDAADELQLRVGQVVEIKSEMNGDWYIGESEGKSGLFPSSYTEEYVPTPTTAVPPPMPSTNRPRNLPPPTSSMQTLHIGSPATTEDESEADSYYRGYSDAEQNMTAPLASAMESTAGHLAKQKYTPQKKSAPPPPPSRRTQSSSNVLSTTPTSSALGSSMLAPPQPAFRRPSNGSNEGSPFGGSDEESTRGCDICDCDEFTQNLFKPNSDTCSSCFHTH